MWTNANSPSELERKWLLEPIDPKQEVIKVNRRRITLNVTNMCQMNCPNCAALCTKHQAQDPDRTFEKLEYFDQFVSESIELGWRWKLIKLSGGEPTLHKDLLEILKIVYRYKRWNPRVCIQLLTNGTTGGFRKMQKAGFPKWLQIRDSSAKGKDAENMFYDMINMAPVDDRKFDDDKFDRGCYRASLGMSMHKGKYYACCGVLANIARVFGFDIGLDSLSDMTDENMTEQMKKVCGYCGSYKRSKQGAHAQATSQTWKEAFEDYNSGKIKRRFAKI